MTKEEYQDFVLRYKGCGACFPLYEKLSKFEKMWFTAIQKDVAELKLKLEALEGDTPWKDIKDKSELIKENAELKEQNKKLLESCEGATMMYEDLCKAKELLKQWVQYGHVNELLEQATLSFINSEVEK